MSNKSIKQSLLEKCKQNGNKVVCFWCGRKVKDYKDKDKNRYLPCLLTVDHLYSRFHYMRYHPSYQKRHDKHVISCSSCNHKRSKKEQELIYSQSVDIAKLNYPLRKWLLKAMEIRMNHDSYGVFQVLGPANLLKKRASQNEG